MGKNIRKIIFITFSVAIVVLGLYVINYSSEGSTVLKSDEISLKKDDNIAIMLANPTGDGYYESNSDTFPTGMILNTTLSNCENGGTISYDGTNVTVEVNKSDKCYVYFDRVQPTLAEYIVSLYDGDGTNDLYYHDKVGTYATYEAGDFSYRYSGPNLRLTTKATNEGYDSPTQYDTTVNGVIKIHKQSGSNYFTQKVDYSADSDFYYMGYDSNIRFSTYYAAETQAIEDGYITQLKNYVCFGSDDSICPGDNLYQIIGVIYGKVKLIKADLANLTSSEDNRACYGSTCYWYANSNYNSNNWYNSYLNNVDLNTVYVANLNAIDNKWMNMIETHDWECSGNTEAYIINTAGAQNVYYREITTSYSSLSKKIGLMHVSDYMYGASPTYWSYQTNYNASNGYNLAKTNNWLSTGNGEWTITRNSDDSIHAFAIDSSGSVYSNYVYNKNGNQGKGVRPTFYLLSNIILSGGSGTAADPYRVSL